MPTNNKFRIALLSVVMTLGFATLNAQILRDSLLLKILKREVDNIYNFQFKEAEDNLQKISNKYPGHPIVMLLEGMITYWKNYPLTTTSYARPSYESEMKICIERCEKFNQEDEVEFLLTNLCARGMLLMFYADNNLTSEVIPLSTTTYRYIRRSFDHTQSYTDFYFFTGLYNYYRDAYPEAHPIYKPVALLFPRGDKNKGMNELLSASRNALLLKAESSSFLSYIYQGFEANFIKASDLTEYLIALYPYNVNYMAANIRNLLLIKKYDSAESLIKSSLSKTSNTYFEAQVAVFTGILQEKKYHNQKLAEEYYKKGINELSAFGNYGNEYAAYAWFGLSRISEINYDRSTKEKFRKNALELSVFESINFDN